MKVCDAEQGLRQRIFRCHGVEMLVESLTSSAAAVQRENCKNALVLQAAVTIAV